MHAYTHTYIHAYIHTYVIYLKMLMGDGEKEDDDGYDEMAMAMIESL